MKPYIRAIDALVFVGVVLMCANLFENKLTAVTVGAFIAKVCGSFISSIDKIEVHR